ncbi:MAG: hypothetical protein R3F60_15265 [bacterium]
MADHCVSGPECVEGLCPRGLICVASVCVDEARLPGECGGDVTCPVGSVCVAGACLPDCGDGAACQLLDAGPDAGPDGGTDGTVGCATDEACGAGRICEAGVCRDGCRADGTCPPASAVIPIA